MKKLFSEVLIELKLVFLGKSIDILLPPILFLVLNSMFNLIIGLIGSLILSMFYLFKRISKKENYYYAVGGFLGTLFAIGMVLLNDNSSNFFLPDIIGTAVLILVTFISLVIKKPLAIWASHITRGWDINWFYRNDVYPAYKEVTIFWLGFFVIRISIEIYLYINASLSELTFANIILGYPVLIAVLTISYIYGITRLHRLGGPGVDEFREGKLPPYRGQNRGF